MPDKNAFADCEPLLLLSTCLYPLPTSHPHFPSLNPPPPPPSIFSPVDYARTF